MRAHLLRPLAARLVLALALLIAIAAQAQPSQYPYGPDSERHDGVPQGKVEKFTFTSQKVFPGTEREAAVYVPAQYDGKQPACVMVFQDGMGYLGDKGTWRVPVVFDNLIAKKEMPVTVGVFLNPGVLPAASGDAKQNLPRYNRSYEYDTPNDLYARFLIEEALPYVEKTYKLNLTKDPNGRGVCGSSSGGIAAFNAAWERPDQFRRVISTIGSFTGLHGGANDLPILVRKFEPKPIRVFLEDGDQDANGYAGDWTLANREMASALKFAGYDFQLVIREGGHSGAHGGPLLPDMLRFVWKGYPNPVLTPERSTDADPKAPHQPIMDVLIPGEGWQVASDGHKFTEGPAVDKEGNVFFTDQGKVWKINAVGDGKTSVFVDKAPGANGAAFGPDGRLYVAQYLGADKGGSIVAYAPDGKAQTVADNVWGNDLCINAKGGIYVTEPDRRQITYIAPGFKERKSYKTRATYPNGVTLTPDQGQLAVADTQGPNLYAYRVEADGSLAHEQAFYAAHVPSGEAGSGADGLRVDAEGRLYAATRLGVQVFDQAGRVVGIMTKPQYQWCANLTFGGPKFDTLYVCCGDKVYMRKTRTVGVNNWQPPVVPKPPRL